MRKTEPQGSDSVPATSGDVAGPAAPSESAIEPAPVSTASWRFAIRECLQGTPAHLLNYLFGAAETDGRGEVTRLYAFPADSGTRWEIVQALLHIGRFSDRLTPHDLMVMERIGTPRERVRDLEIGAAELFKLGGASTDEMADLADALKLEPESLARRIRDRRKKAKGKD